VEGVKKFLNSLCRKFLNSLCRKLLGKKRRCFIFALLTVISILQVLVGYLSSPSFSFPYYAGIFFVILFNILATNLIDYIAKTYFPLEEGTDPNTKEHNVCIRGSSMFTLIKDLKDVSATARKIGMEFANRAGIRNEKELIERWKETDVQAAFFFEDLDLHKEGKGYYSLHIKKPFWMKERNLLEDIRSSIKTGKLHPICKFFKEYCRAIIESAHKKNVKVSYTCEKYNQCLEENCILQVVIITNEENGNNH